MRRSPRTRLFAASVAVVATLGLAACGDDDDDTSSTTAVEVTLSTAGTDETEVTVTEDTDVDVTVDTTDSTAGSTPTSGSGEVGSKDDYTEVARNEIRSRFDDDDLADCVGEAMVNDDVYAAIEDAGITVDEFSEDGPAGLQLEEAVADQVAEDFAACGDLLPEIVKDDAARDCAEENITNDQVAEFMAFTLLEIDPSADVAAAVEAADACVNAGTTTTT